MIDILRAAEQWLNDEENLVLAVICAQDGSTPREAGACMIVRRDKTIAGTIGGGIVEGGTITACVDMLESGRKTEIRTFNLDNTLAAQSGMVCGGNLEVCLQHFSPGKSAASFFRTAHHALRAGKKTALLCELSDSAPQRCVLVEGTPYAGCDAFSENLIKTARRALAEKNTLQMLDADDSKSLLLPLTVPETAVIAGAGHVALFTARVLAMVGFRTVIIDDREDFANRDRFPEASEILITDGFDNCLSEAGITEDSYIVILTRGHLYDKTVLAEALRTGAAYIGMIGSRKKRDASYDALRAEGVKDEALERVHCPIGLSIEAETPEEIAVSIAAEIIRARAANRINHA